MIAPEDVVSGRVLPTLRSLLASALAAHGLTERTIAERLGVTQSAVSKYLRGRLRSEPRVATAPTFLGLFEDLSGALAEDRISPLDLQSRIREAVEREEDRGVICALHEDVVPALRGLGCDICVRGRTSDAGAEQESLADLRSAVRALLAVPGFETLIPNVGSNFARARDGAETAEDVAAIPGRLFVMRGAARSPAAPEFGASKHVAEVLLAVGKRYPSVRAAVNIRWDDRIATALESVARTPTPFDPRHEGQAEAIARDLPRGKAPPQVLYQAGAFGVEPVAYLLGDTAQDVVACVKQLLQALAR